jgi:hypothetical protein
MEGEIFIWTLLIYTLNRGYFCDGTCQNAVPKVLSRKDASWNDITEPFPPGSGITAPSSHRILGHYAFRNLCFKGKIALEVVHFKIVTYCLH